jgi:hypothetical protein
MNPFFITSYLITLSLLILTSVFNHSKYRLFLKLVTCAHYMGLAIYAIASHPVPLLKYLLFMGLVSSYFGDLFLGIKDKLKLGFLIGIGTFSIAQLYYLLYLQLNQFNYWPFILSIIFILLFWYYVQHNSAIHFTQKAYFLIVYIFLLSSTMFSSIYYYLMMPNVSNLYLLIGFIAFFISDMTLFHVYFLIKKRTLLIVLYLLFYHLAQCLIAYYLWL